MMIYLAIALTTVSLAMGYGQQGRWPEAGAIGLLGLGWLAARRYRWGWLPYLALAVTVILAALGLLQGLPFGWMLGAVAAALAAWDAAQPRPLQSRGYRQRLAIILSLGLLLGLASQLVPVSLNLGGAVLLGLAGVIGLHRILSGFSPN